MATTTLERSGEKLADSGEKLADSGGKLVDSAEKIEESTEQVEASTVRIEGSADRRTLLAADRTVLAAERTYAAWVRTGLVALASGIGAKTLLKGVVPEWMIIANGSVLVLFSAFCFVVAVWRELNPVAAPRPDMRRIPPWMLIGLNAFLALVSLAALLGIWFGRTGGMP
jgi:putative membrane protein